MTEKLFDTDSHIKEFTATVLSCEKTDGGYETELSRTAFFYEGGGQESDRGFIDGVFVKHVKEENGRILHITDSPFTAGSTVKGVIDWERRFDFMQQHSGEHIVSGIAHTVYGCENVGFHLSENIVSLDLDRFLSREELLDIESKANKAIHNNVKFRVYYPDKETLAGLSYRSKKEISGDTRIVEIENTDVCACCAPHVKTAAEIGIIKLLDSEKLRGGVRIEIKCGSRALADYNDKYSNVREIAASLAVKQTEAAAAVNRLSGEIADLKAKLSEMKRREILSIASANRTSREVSAVFCDGLEIKELQILCDALFKQNGGIRGAFSASQNGFSFAVCGDTKLLDGFFADMKSRFNVRGGGRNGMVQGSIFAEKEEIELFFQ